jgi:hypothetical protein
MTQWPGTSVDAGRTCGFDEPFTVQRGWWPANDSVEDGKEQVKEGL